MTMQREGRVQSDLVAILAEYGVLASRLAACA